MQPALGAYKKEEQEGRLCAHSGNSLLPELGPWPHLEKEFKDTDTKAAEF